MCVLVVYVSNVSDVSVFDTIFLCFIILKSCIICDIFFFLKKLDLEKNAVLLDKTKTLLTVIVEMKYVLPFRSFVPFVNL